MTDILVLAEVPQMCCMNLHPCSSTILASRILTYLECLSIHLWGTRFSGAKGNQLKAGRGGGGVRKNSHLHSLVSPLVFLIAAHPL